MGGSFHSRGESWHSKMSLQVLKSFKTVTEEKENSQSVFLPDKLLHCCDQRGKQAGIAATDIAKARAFKNKVLLIQGSTYWGSLEPNSNSTALSSSRRCFQANRKREQRTDEFNWYSQPLATGVRRWIYYDSSNSTKSHARLSTENTRDREKRNRGF